MRFDKKAEKRAWLAIMCSVSGLIFMTWLQHGRIGFSQVLIILGAICIIVIILYFVKWFLNQ